MNAKFKQVCHVLQNELANNIISQRVSEDAAVYHTFIGDKEYLVIVQPTDMDPRQDDDVSSDPG